jgi:hypothetical protein
MNTINEFKWSDVEGHVEIDEMLKILKTRMKVIRDNFTASSESMTADHKAEMDTAMTNIKESLKRKFNLLIQQSNPLGQQQKRQKTELKEIMDLTTVNMGSEATDECLSCMYLKKKI